MNFILFLTTPQATKVSVCCEVRLSHFNLCFNILGTSYFHGYHNKHDLGWSQFKRVQVMINGKEKKERLHFNLHWTIVVYLVIHAK